MDSRVGSGGPVPNKPVTRPDPSPKPSPCSSLSSTKRSSSEVPERRDFEEEESCMGRGGQGTGDRKGKKDAQTKKWETSSNWERDGEIGKKVRK